ncbi:MAG: HupE/UreJ family protein [Geminicoccaceae bacterium]
MSLRTKASAGWLLAALLLSSLPAEAHAPIKGIGDFYAGMLHPLTDLVQLLPLLGLGLLAGEQPGEGRLLAAVLCAAAALLALLSLPKPGPAQVTVLLTACTILAGAATAAVWPRTLVAVLLLAVATGLGLGWTQQADIEGIGRPNLFLGGAALAALLLVLYVTLIVQRLPAGWPRIGVRVAGSWLVAIAAMVLALWFRSLPPGG